MRLATPRALGAAVALATGLALAQTAWAPAWAEDGRITTVQADPELQKRADLLMKSVVDGGGKVSWGSLEAGSGPESVVLKQITLTSPDGKKLTIEEINVRTMDWANAQEPRHADITMKKLVIAADAMDKEAADNIKELGLTEIVINGELAFKFDEGEKSFDVGKVFVDFENLGELKLRLKLTGITPADIKAATGEKPEKTETPAAPDAAMTLLSRLNLAGAAIAFKDKGVMALAFKSEAKKKNISESAAKNKLIEELTEERGKAEDEVTKELIDAFVKFVRTPGEIEFVAAPSAPANVMMAFMTVMGNRSTFKQMLGLSVAVK